MNIETLPTSNVAASVGAPQSDESELVSVVPFVRIHADSEAPRECCGVVIEGPEKKPVYVACRNIGGETEHFIIDPKDYANAEDGGRVLAIAHSHPFMSPAPSGADLTGIERTGLPWLIVNHPTGAFTITRPSGYRAPLVGREFVHGVHDCYGLVRDYFAERGVVLNDYPRTFNWWKDPNGPDLYRANFATEGFVVVHDGPLDSASLRMVRKHDLILMRFLAAQDNHMAVYLGDGVILHHLVSQLSRREYYGEHWQRRTTAVLRHKSFMES
jgi:proteasome lid subunit RPN8/RPN11